MSVQGPTNNLILYWCILRKIRFKQMHIFNKYIKHRNKVGMVRTKKKWTYLVFRKIMISANKRTMGLHYYDFNFIANQS